MDITYKKLWKLLIDKEIGKGQLKELSGVSGNIIAKLGKDEPVSLESLVKIAVALKVDIGDIISLEEKQAIGGINVEIKLIDNKGDNTLENLLSDKITSHSKINIQTAAFSIFAFNALQKEIKRS